MEKQLHCSAVTRRLIAQRENRQVELNTQKCKRILNILALHVFILDVALAALYFIIV